MILECPLPTALTAIPQPTCQFNMFQISRFAFQRRQASTAPPFANLVAIQTKANWDTLKAAADSTKVVMSPIFNGFTITPSEGLVAGGNDNSTFNGIPDYNGEGFAQAQGQWKGLPPLTKRALDRLAMESLSGATGVSNLTIYMFNSDGYSFQRNPTGTEYFGIPIYNFRLSSYGNEGFNAKTITNFSFTMPPNWGDYLTSVLPTFDPLTDI
jgi:hypothetical protein